MLRGLKLLLALSLGLLQLSEGQPLLVEPQERVVAVALGTSQKLTCSLACAHGPAAVHWRGLDTSLGAVQSDPGLSVLWLLHASLADAGTRVCRGSCGGRTFQHQVEVLVYAFPEQLTVSPAVLKPGQDREVACTAHSVTPWGPDALSFSLLWRDQELEGIQVLDREEVEEEEASLKAEGPLFRVTQRWLLPTLRTLDPATLRCQATMQLPFLELSHHRPLPVLFNQTTPEPPSLSSPEAPSPTLLKSSDLTSLEPPDSTSTAHPKPISTAHPDFISTAHASSTSTAHSTFISTVHPNSTSIAHPNPISTEHPDFSPQSSPEQAFSNSPSSPRSCYPEIHQAPPTAMGKAAGWGLLCQASCGHGVTVRWTLAPGGLAAYENREAGTWAWLSVPLMTNPTPKGWFQCRLEPGGQVASLYVQGQNAVPTSSPEVAQPSAALWLGSVALGLLLLLTLVTRHLWKHCWPAARDLPHPPVCLGLLPVQDSEGVVGLAPNHLQG
ncbi:mucosal addressin cell adhesion molecule 1 [Octodon degus]|uniref:Mucosal addressin cell adhesion molecule 1 n=1 Tax=Octodon degus TaxID=10160 RepID=A0A6P6EK16_OCTDE|nr:mucosal addressin cell adhesion molecule 1 [Octodon degus]